MNYEKKLKEIINSNNTPFTDIDILVKYFPELLDSKDERIRKVLVGFFKSYKEQGTCGSETFNEIPTDNILAWLEKQGKQDMIPLDKVIKFLDEQLVNDKDAVTGEPFINFQNYGAFKETFISYFKRKMLEKQGEKFIPEDINEAASQYVDTCAVDGEITHDNVTEPYWNNHSMMSAYKAGWLEKQGESDKSLYIRFGDIPTNGKSKIYNGEIEIGIEEGISVYPAFEDKEGNIILGLNFPITKTSLHTQQHLLEYDNRPCYLVTGDYVGKGTDGEPLIKNVRIIKEIKPYRVKEDKENNTYVINNTPNCSISVYNEEPKESEDERIRKDLIYAISRDWLRNGNNIGESKTTKKEALAWLKKQGEQKPADTDESKFNTGDWISNGRYTKLIVGINSDWPHYMFNDGTSERIKDIDKKYHLWSIADVKDGDVLVYNNSLVEIILLFKKWKEGIGDGAYSYVHIFDNKILFDDWSDCGYSAHPATKEQREQLFRAMHEAGYEWNEEQKELRKIEKQGEKPKWTKEDEREFRILDYTLRNIGQLTSANWIESLKKRMKE